MGSTAACPKKVILLLLLIPCLIMLSLSVDFCVWSFFCYAVLSVLSSFAIITLRKRELVALLALCSCCLMAASALCLSSGFLFWPTVCD